MKTSAIYLSSLLGLFLFAAPPARGQRPLPEGATLPAHPATLLSTLPKPPAGWEMTTSRGENLNLSWLITDVERTLTKVQFAEGENPGAPPVTRIHLRDTGNYRGYLMPFANFRPDPPDSTSTVRRRVVIGSFPAFVTQESSGTTVKLLIGKRYLVDMVLENQPPTAIGIWLQAFDMGALSSIDNTPLSAHPTQAQLISVDELNPGNNDARVATLSAGNMAVKTAGGQLSEEDRATLAEEAAEQAAIAAEMKAEAANAAAGAGALPEKKKEGE